MLDQYSGLYQGVASELTRVLPRGWSSAYVQVEMEPDNGSIACFAVSSPSSKPVHVKLPVAVFERFAQMQQIARDSDARQVWTTATFVLRNDGKFEVDYGYEPIPIEAQFNRRIAWKKRYGLI